MVFFRYFSCTFIGTLWLLVCGPYYYKKFLITLRELGVVDKNMKLCGTPLDLFIDRIHANDYLNPFTLTFKNPKTVEMLNIIILYHYVMAFLVGIVVFTFIFIFLSFFRSYPFFYSKPADEFIDFDEEELDEQDPIMRIVYRQSQIEEFFHDKKKEYMAFYKNDIKKAISDQVTHAPILEFLWVVLPAIILIFIAYPSVMMLYYNEAYVNPIYNISAIGNQGYGTYEYMDFNLRTILERYVVLNTPMFVSELNLATQNVIELISTIDKKFRGGESIIEADRKTLRDLPYRVVIDSNLIIAKDPKFLRLLSTDQCLVIPSKTPLRIIVTSVDVIHSWAIPSYGVKLDAVPGRANQQMLNIPLVGTSGGQCSELCGVNHAYMPIEIKVLSFGDFLFYMELKVKEIITPYLLKYYTTRLNVLIGFVDALRENVDHPFLKGISKDKDFVEKILNSKKLFKYLKS